MRLIRREKRDHTASPQMSGFTPLSQLNQIRSEINRIFEDPFSLITPSSAFLEGWTPTVDVYEDKDKFTVKAEIPGMKKNEIEISLHGNTLTLSGERKRETEHKEGETYRAERYFGRFQRSLTLDTPVDSGRVEASYKDGVLTITCPKSEESKPKQIQVKA